MSADGTGDPDWDPVKYEEFRSERELPFHDLVGMLPHLQGRRCVDLGCGPGRLTAMLHEHLGLAETLGVDSSPAMIATAAGFAGNGVTFEERDILDMARSHDTGSFDLVFSNAALQWLPDHETLVPAVARLVAPGGWLAVQIPANFDHPSHTLAEETSRRPEWSGYFDATPPAPRVLDPERYAELLFGLAMEDVEVLMRVYLHPLPGRESLIDWVQGTLLNWYARCVPEDRWPDFLADYRESLEQALPDRRPFLLTFKRILFTARRPES